MGSSGFGGKLVGLFWTATAFVLGLYVEAGVLSAIVGGLVFVDVLPAAELDFSLNHVQEEIDLVADSFNLLRPVGFASEGGGGDFLGKSDVELVGVVDLPLEVFELLLYLLVASQIGKAAQQLSKRKQSV